MHRWYSTWMVRGALLSQQPSCACRTAASEQNSSPPEASWSIYSGNMRSALACSLLVPSHLCLLTSTAVPHLAAFNVIMCTIRVESCMRYMLWFVGTRLLQCLTSKPPALSQRECSFAACWQKCSSSPPTCENQKTFPFPCHSSGCCTATQVCYPTLAQHFSCTLFVVHP